MSFAHLVALALMLFGCSSYADAQVPSDELRRFGVTVVEAAAGEQHATLGGVRVELTGKVALDAWLLGANVDVGADIGRDLTVRAGNLRVRGKIAGTATLTGADVRVDSSIGTNLEAEAAKLEVTDATTIGGEVIITGADVVYAGDSVGEVTISGRRIEFNGKSKGAVTLTGTRIEVGAGTIVNGDLTIFTIGEPRIDANAKISGKVIQESLYKSEEMRPFMGRWLPAEAQIALVLGASALIAGILFLFAGRTSLEETINGLVEQPAASLGWGLAALIAVPLFAALLAISVIGIPLGVCALLALPVLLLLGYAHAGYGLGERVFNGLGDRVSGGTRVILLLAGLLGLGLISLIPYAGFVVSAIAALMGTGAMLRTFYHRMR